VAKSDTQVDLSPDPIVSGSPNYNEPVLRLRGYVGEQRNGKVRLYWDISKTSYYEIEVADIVDRVRLSEVDGSLVVIKLSANLGVVESGSISASWLEGAITSTLLGEASEECMRMFPPSTYLPKCETRFPPSTHRVYAGWPPTTKL